MLTKEKEGVRPEIPEQLPNDRDLRKKRKRDSLVPHAFIYSAKTIIKLVFRTRKGENTPQVIFKGEKSSGKKRNRFPVTESEERQAIIVFQWQEIKSVAEKYARPSGKAHIRLGSAETKREESPGRRSQKAVAGCKVEAIVGAEEITGNVESRRAKLNDKQRAVKREKTRGKAEINSHKDVFSRGQESGKK